jgi:hypothetical protein
MSASRPVRLADLARKPWRIAPATLVVVLTSGAALDQVLLWRFLGLIGNVGAGLASLMVLSGAVIALRGRRTWLQTNAPDGNAARDAADSPAASAHLSGTDAIRPALLALCLCIALPLCILGGEGRLLYATTDWQVRGAVLRDLTLYSWPFVYDEPGGPWLLRAPLGMYLAPALIGKAAGLRAAEFALLAQNTVLLGSLFALATPLFDTIRTRLSALAVFLGFSGMDAIGQFLAGQPLRMNAERWNYAIYSAHLDQLYWVPQHALVGWAGALLYLLWRAGKLPLAAVLTPLPLLALWSPLGLIGVAPFAAHAGIATLLQRQLRRGDILLPAATTVLALPGLLYLASGSGSVGGGVAALPFHQYIAFEALEVAPYLLGLWFVAARARFGGVTLAITTAVLLMIPYGQIGSSTDFTMRASIAPLAILALGVADALLRPSRTGDALGRFIMAFALGVGLVTPAFETWHALSLPRAPRILCSYFGVVPGGFPTYVAPLGRIAGPVAPHDPARIKPDDPARCWSTPWPQPLLYADQLG